MHDSYNDNTYEMAQSGPPFSNGDNFVKESQYAIIGMVKIRKIGSTQDKECDVDNHFTPYFGGQVALDGKQIGI